MPPFLAVALGAVASFALARVVMREWNRVNGILHPQGETPPQGEFAREALPKLRPDPRTGVYRPDRRA
jgi:hypothetical protein